jgi:hypothetical protein
MTTDDEMGPSFLDWLAKNRQRYELEQTTIEQRQKISLLEKKIAGMTGFSGGEWDEPGVATKKEIRQYFREQGEYLASEKRKGR